MVVHAILPGSLGSFEIEILDDVQVVHQTGHSWILDLGLRGHGRFLLSHAKYTFWSFEPLRFHVFKWLDGVAGLQSHIRSSGLGLIRNVGNEVSAYNQRRLSRLLYLCRDRGRIGAQRVLGQLALVLNILIISFLESVDLVKVFIYGTV